jgi:cell wall-associated NlpC family hydrolase
MRLATAPARQRAHRSPGSRLRAAAVTAALTAGVLAGAVSTTATEAHAAGTTTSQPTAAQVRAAKIDRVMTWARHQKGDPYRYGAAGPNAFDCSGFTMYVFQHALGRSLPHNAAAQYRAVRHISRRSLRPGDLVFASFGSGISHVGIYAGNGYMWHAPHSGTVVKKAKMYHAHWYFGRIIR